MNDIVVADVDNDGNREIIVAVSDSQVYAFDGVTHQLDGLEAVPAYALSVDDIDADGQLEILVGQTTGEIAVYDGATFSQESLLYPASLHSVTALLVEDVDGDGAKEVLIAGNNGLMVYDSSVSELLQQSGGLGAELGRYNHLVSRDVDADGRKELFIGSDIALYQFEQRRPSRNLEDAAHIFADLGILKGLHKNEEAIDAMPLDLRRYLFQILLFCSIIGLISGNAIRFLRAPGRGRYDRVPWI